MMAFFCQHDGVILYNMNRNMSKKSQQQQYQKEQEIRKTDYAAVAARMQC